MGTSVFMFGSLVVYSLTLSHVVASVFSAKAVDLVNLSLRLKELEAEARCVHQMPVRK